MIKNEDIETLMEFGLSHLQASTFLTLAKLKQSDVRTIARLSNAARQDIYRIMPSLQKLGLVVQIVGLPTKYQALPLKNAIALLLEHKKQEYSQLLVKTSSLIENFKKSKNFTISEGESGLVISSQLSLLMSLHKKIMQECEKTLDIIVPLHGVSRKLSDEWQFLGIILERKEVEVRLITTKPTFTDSMYAFWEPLIPKNNFHVKYLESAIDIGMHIFDRKQLTMAMHGTQTLPSLWSNNPNILRLATYYFDSLWKAEKKA